VLLIMPVVRLAFTAWADVDDSFVRPFFIPNGHQQQPGTAATYVAGLTQLDAFAIGALLSLHFWRFEGRVSASAVVAFASVMVVLGALVTGTFGGAIYAPHLGTPGAYQYVWGYSLVALLGALLVVYAARFAAVPDHWRPLATLGVYSYEFYILHFAILEVYETFVPCVSTADQVAEAAVCFPITVFLAIRLNRAGRQVVQVFSRRRSLATGQGSS
jgi:peptidoglycan/LPS O-acetylase OafA/YrhL